MKSIKKRSKRLLADIQTTADRLAVLCADLDLLQSLFETASQIGDCAVKITEQISAAHKTEAAATLTQSPELARLADFVDMDAISLLEERIFAAQSNLEEGDIGVFFQQLLEKSEKFYATLTGNIQQLLTLAEEAEEG